MLTITTESVALKEGTEEVSLSSLAQTAEAISYSDMEDMLDQKMGKMVTLLTRLDVANADIVRRLAKLEKLVKKLTTDSDLVGIPEHPLVRTDSAQRDFMIRRLR